jgi:uncharacterized protein (DUF302 family)
MRENHYSMHRALPDVGFGEAVDRVTGALAVEGFGVLTRIDVHDTLREKIGAEFRPYTILGACNPGLAHRALVEDDNIGLMLPCNVVIAATDEGTEVAVMRPHAMMDVADSAAIGQVADEAQQRLQRALESL